MSTEKMRVYFTVDTETSMAGAWNDPTKRPLPLERSIFGKNDSEYYGIPLIMDILEAHGFRGTFFTEMLCSYVLGRSEVQNVVSYIRSREHDVQLHLHPVYWYYHCFLQGQPRREKDLMFELPLDEQEKLIRIGVDLFGQFSGVAPRAYRAGCYGASEVTLDISRRLGIEVDSSYNLCYLDRSCGFQRRPLNGPAHLAGIQEFPVTNFRVAFQPGYKPLEIGAVSVGEILTTMNLLKQAGCRDVVISLHSFSFIKVLTERHCQPDRVAIHRFKKLCAAISQLSGEVDVAVLGEANLGDGPLNGSDCVPCLGLVRPAMRKVVQGLNRIPWI